MQGHFPNAFSGHSAQQLDQNQVVYTNLVILAEQLRNQLRRALDENEKLLNEVTKQNADKGSTNSGSSQSQDCRKSDSNDVCTQRKTSTQEKTEKRKKKVWQRRQEDNDSDYIPFVQQKQNGENEYSDPKEDTKNVVKTLTTLICNYITENSSKVRRILQQKQVGKSFNEFCRFNNKIKAEISSLTDLKKIWIARQDSPSKLTQFKECFRILSFEYLRNHLLSHIFDSTRIRNKKLYMKCRTKLLEGIMEPDYLCNLKDY